MNERDAAASIERWFRAAVDAVEPARAVNSHLRYEGNAILVDGANISVTGRLLVVSVGKAAAGMARGANEVCGDAISDGIVLTKEGHLDRIPPQFRSFEAGHPVPDRRGVHATQHILDLVSKAGPDDVVLVLLSGGGSALLEAPIDGVTLEDVASITDLLLMAGAPIQHLNAVRTPLSRVKGGGLRRAAPVARFITMLLSDVLGNDPRVIASGPTVASAFTREGALELIERYGLGDRAPAAVISALGRATEDTKDADFQRDIVTVVGDNAAAIIAFANAASDDGVSHLIIGGEIQGEARELAIDWVKHCIDTPTDIDLLVGGGEATVTVTGDGIGGRNTEWTLAAALELERLNRNDWAVASLATDGQDAMTGAAGAIATACSMVRGREAGIEPEVCLTRNDSLTVFEQVDSAVVTGPTGTNVNDIYVAMRLG